MSPKRELVILTLIEIGGDGVMMGEQGAALAGTENAESLGAAREPRFEIAAKRISEE